MTWSRDQTLRVWKVDEQLQKLCGKDDDNEETGVLLEEYSSQQDANKIPNSKTNNGDITQPSCSLQHEFSLLNTNIPHIDVEVLDPIKRCATVRITANGYVIMLQITFPQNYPNPGDPPEFNYCQGTSLDENLSNSLMKVLKICANQRVKKSRTCLEQCIRALVTALKKVP